MTAKDLKNALLQEAVQGKLVPQIASEGNARDLLNEIKCQKAKLIADGKIKKEKPLPEITDDEKPFDIPESWCWCRLGEIVSFGICQNAEPQDIQADDWILDLEDIEKDSGRIIAFKTKKDTDSKSTKHIFKKGFVLYSKLRPYLNKCVVAPKDGFCTSEILPLDFGEKIFNRYAQAYLMSPFFVGYTNSLSFGVKMPRLGTDDGKKALFPLPPLAEQKRIVAAIERFMPLIEEYGIKEDDLRQLNASIGEQAKKALLQEAVQGRLVPQMVSEGNARDLLKQIQAEKARLIIDGKLKKEKPLPPITDDEKPFEIPESWCWCRLGEIVAFGQCQNAEPNEIQDNDWVLDLEDIEKDSGKILAFKQKKDVDLKSTKHIFKKDYVLYSKLRPYLNKCVIAPKDGFCTSEILPLDFGHNIFNKYAQLYLMSPFFVDYTNSLSYGVKMPRLGTEDGKKALFPLPPIAEQKRIVAKLEELLGEVEKLR